MNGRRQHRTEQCNQNRVLDTKSRQMKESHKRKTYERQNSLLANGLSLSFLFSFFFPFF